MKRLDHIGPGTKERPKPLGAAFYTESDRQAKVFKDAHPLTDDQRMRGMLAIMMGLPLPKGLPVFEDSDGLHTHVCGFDERKLNAKGCGHVWRHESHDACDSGKKHFDVLHTCPNCGSGLWTFKLPPDDPRLIET